jgi:hypothetical protein
MKIRQLICAVALNTAIFLPAYAQQVDPQVMQQRFEQMQALMDQAQNSQNFSQRHNLMLQHMQLMQQQIQSMNGMMGGYGTGGSMMRGGTMGGAMMGGGMMGQGGNYPEGQAREATQEQLINLNNRINLMQQMMEQMLEQQKLIMQSKK